VTDLGYGGINHSSSWFVLLVEFPLFYTLRALSALRFGAAVLFQVLLTVYWMVGLVA